MDKVFSARIDESVARRIGALAHRLKTSKKNIIERAIDLYATQLEKDEKVDVFAQTCGSWNRKESPQRIVEDARETFRKSMMRHQP